MRSCAAGRWMAERVELYQLLPLLVHAVLFGGSYAAAAERAARYARLYAALLSRLGAVGVEMCARNPRRRRCICSRGWWSRATTAAADAAGWPGPASSPRQLQRAYAQFGEISFRRISARRMPRRRAAGEQRAIPCATSRASSAIARRRTSPVLRRATAPRRAFASGASRRSSASAGDLGTRRSGSSAPGRRRRISVPPPAAGSARDAAAVLLGDLSHDREPETRARPAARLGAAVEAVEDVRQVLRGDPRPVVAHGQLPPVRGRPRPARPAGCT